MMGETMKKDNKFVGYEYKNVTVTRAMEPIYADSYTNFGWILDGTETPHKGISWVTLTFKRDRKIRNKAELTRLQRQFDGCIAEIETLERSRVIIPSATAYTIGIIGTAFMAGSFFAYNADQLSLSIVLAIPGFIGWLIPYLVYYRLRRRKTAKVQTLINQKYGESYKTCEKAHSLLPE